MKRLFLASIIVLMAVSGLSQSAAPYFIPVPVSAEYLLTSVETYSSDNRLMGKLNYEYDINSLPKKCVTCTGMDGNLTEEIYEYEYDDGGRLMKEIFPTFKREYAYDMNGNISQESYFEVIPNTASGEYVKTSMIVREFDNQSRVLSEINYFSGMIIRRTTCEYDADLKTEVIENFDESGAVLYKYKTVYKKEGDRYDEIAREAWVNGELTGSTRTEYKYEEYPLLIKGKQEYFAAEIITYDLLNDTQRTDTDTFVFDMDGGVYSETRTRAFGVTENKGFIKEDPDYAGSYMLCLTESTLYTPGYKNVQEMSYDDRMRKIQEASLQYTLLDNESEYILTSGSETDTDYDDATYTITTKYYSYTGYNEKRKKPAVKGLSSVVTSVYTDSEYTTLLSEKEVDKNNVVINDKTYEYDLDTARDNVNMFCDIVSLWSGKSLSQGHRLLSIKDNIANTDTHFNYEYRMTTGADASAVGEACPVEYFNLQGMCIDLPGRGFYIRRQGADVSKVYIR